MTCYVAIAADINNKLETFYYIKVGQTEGFPAARCNAQRLKLVWTTHYQEKTLLSFAFDMFGESAHDYRCCGYTESFGNFQTVIEAFNNTLLLAETLQGNWISLDRRRKKPCYDLHPMAERLIQELKNGQ
jgi:hypothetical protein